jgi:hypothetical protein
MPVDLNRVSSLMFLRITDVAVLACERPTIDQPFAIML